LGPLGTAATNWSIMPEWNDDWQGKPKYSEKTYPSAALSTTNPTCSPDANPGRRGWKSATNRLSYGRAYALIYSPQQYYVKNIYNEPLHSVIIQSHITFPFLCRGSPGWRSRYGDWLRASTAEMSEFKSRYGQDFFPLHAVQTGLMQWVPGVLSPKVKRPGHECDHSSSTSAEVKNTQVYTYTPTYVSWRSA
jgi:hypothetical protein